MKRKAPLKTTKPMKRGGFKPLRAPCPAKQMDDYTPKPRPLAQAARPGPAAVSPLRAAPKFEYVRDTRLRDMCRAMACQHCGARGEAAGVTWAHSNQAVHGKGKAIKASDVFIAAMCTTCHRELDQGKRWTLEQKILVWGEAHRRTVLLAVRKDTWPIGIPLPIQIDVARPLRGRQLADADYERALEQGGRWMSAADVALVLAMSRHMVAHALRRLAEDGRIEEEVVELPTATRVLEHSRVYRARLQEGQIRQLQNGLPRWLAPQAIVAIGEPQRVMGRAGMRRWEQDDERIQSRPGMPGGPEKGAASTNDNPVSTAGAGDDAAAGG